MRLQHPADPVVSSSLRSCAEDLRVVPCETCGTEGRIIRQALYHSSAHVGAPDEIDYGECPDCDGTGGALVEVEPIEEDDLFP